MKKTLTILLLICSLQSFSQLEEFKVDESKFAMRIKNFDEFIERFNFQYPMLIEKEGYFKRDTITRNQFLKTIFLKDLLDVDSLGKIQEIIRSIVDANIKINPFDSSIYVRGNFQCEINKNSISLPIILTPVLQGKGFKWAINDMSPNFIPYLKVIDINDSVYINPTNNDLYFNQVSKMLSNKEFDNIFSAEYLHKKELMFYRGLNSGQIKIGSCDQMDYFIFHVPNWVIQVSLVNDESKLQTGWLISKLYNVKNANKISFFNDFIL